MFRSFNIILLFKIPPLTVILMHYRLGEYALIKQKDGSVIILHLTFPYVLIRYLKLPPL